MEGVTVVKYRDPILKAVLSSPPSLGLCVREEETEEQTEEEKNEKIEAPLIIALTSIFFLTLCLSGTSSLASVCQT